MKYESLEQAIHAMDKFQQTKAAYDHAMGVLYLDATTVAPSDTWEGRGKTMEVLSGICYALETSPDVNEWLTYLEANTEKLSCIQKRQMEVIRKNYDKIHRIPAEEYVAFTVRFAVSPTMRSASLVERATDSSSPVDASPVFTSLSPPSVS